MVDALQGASPFTDNRKKKRGKSTTTTGRSPCNCKSSVFLQVKKIGFSGFVDANLALLCCQ
jgi:hypothetical protein